MNDDKKSLLGDLTQDLGIGATVTVVITALWAGGWWQWIPAVLVAALGLSTLLLERRLPWHGVLLKDIEQLNNGAGNHPSLQQKITSSLDAMAWSEVQGLIGHKRSTLPNRPSRWLRGLVLGQERINNWIGKDIWTFQSYNKTLFISFIYPVFLLLFSWTIEGRNGIFENLTTNNSTTTATRVYLTVSLFWIIVTSILININRQKIGKDNFRPNIILLALVFCLPAWLLASIIDTEFDSSPALIQVFSFAFTLIILGWLSSAVKASEIGALITIYAGAHIGYLIFRLNQPYLAAVIFCASLYFGVFWYEKKLAFVKNEKLLKPHLVAIGISTTALFLLATIGTIIPKFIPLISFSVKSKSFHSALLLSLLWMPAINAIFDWLSLGITRELLRRMTRSPAWMWGGVVLDVLAGVALTLGLLWLAFQVLAFMQWCGWPVDAQAMRAAFIANPFDPQVSWLAMLAVTNLLPTIWHLGVSLWGLVDRQFTTSVSLKDSLKKLNDFMDEKGNPKPGAAAPGLGELELQTVYHSLFVHPWLYVGTVVAVVVGFWGSYVQALRWTLTWLP